MQKVRFLVLALVLAAALAGAGFAAWSQVLPVGGTLATGELDWYFSGMGGMDTGEDYVCDPGFGNERQMDKDVARTTLARQDADGDGDYDTVRVTVINAYPTYYNQVSLRMTNNGSIPLKVGTPVIDGPTAVTVRARDLDEIGGRVLNPGSTLNIVLDFRINEAAQDNSSYTFSVTLPATQWNAN
ncbi:MAG: hypothetical protein ACPLQP_09205 [Moorellaceae bacterium]